MPFTCVAPTGEFCWGVHKPDYGVRNLRRESLVTELGRTPGGEPVMNPVNFPPGDVRVSDGEWIYEVANPFPFRGATYIIKSAADRIAMDPSVIALPRRPEMSFTSLMAKWNGADSTPSEMDDLFTRLPEPLMLAIASNSTDERDLIRMAHRCARFTWHPETGEPAGMEFDPRTRRPAIANHLVFEALANNPALPVAYRRAMVLRPGIQGDSPIVGDISAAGRDTHVYEYLRANSYIPHGHYAANMADDAVRYRAQDLTLSDVRGMRHLYYQRTYIRLADMLGLPLPAQNEALTENNLESLRERILGREMPAAAFDQTLWGWNFGFDFSPSGYRLHASHQQVHQQYALIPSRFSETMPKGRPPSESPRPFAFGELIADFTRLYHSRTGARFFDACIQAIRANRRMDGDAARPDSLIVHADENVLLFVPKAQTSQWELQLMTTRPVGNILEADADTRAALDRGIWTAAVVLERLGARMITVIEAAKPFTDPSPDQRLLYCFLPKLPYSPGSFTEAQLRWITGHYPEDFAEACRRQVTDRQSHPAIQEPVLKDIRP